MRIVSTLFVVRVGACARSNATGLKTLESAQPLARNRRKLEAAIKARGMKVFTRIDHAAAATEAGLSMPQATVVIFGAPKAARPIS